MIFAVVALIPVTYLFINRDAIYRERRRAQWMSVAAAVVWGLVYGLLLTMIIGILGVVAGVAVGLYAYFR